MKLHLVSLGCARNLVDSETMTARLVASGYTLTSDPALAHLIIVNTCSFIEPAVNESIDTILALAEFKKTGVCERLVVSGCLPQRFKEEISPTLPEVDAFLGTGAFDEIVKIASADASLKKCHFPDPDLIAQREADVPRILTVAHSAYLKIAEGCSRHCTYCIIPSLRGRQKSRFPDPIVAEAEALVAGGVKELVLVAQDTTAYGRDLSPPKDLAPLITRLGKLSRDIWIRLLYGHPESIDDNTIRTIAAHDNICSYFDIPIQHASAPILKRMGRGYDGDALFRLYDNIRKTVPDAALRTSVIVGFPGETDRDFDTLLDFAKQIRFDHLGVFVYSDAKEQPSHRLPDHVPEKIAQERYDRLMAVQLEISAENNLKHLNQIYPVLVEEAPEEGLFMGRTAFQAPEVDGITYIHSPSLTIGSFADIKIIDALEYDLTGEVA
jgi:ribosomal protein S12 methylthiotransferase